jgi:penicillin-binding protein 1A
MGHALKGVPVSEPPVPSGVVQIGGEWYYEEYARGSGVSSLGLQNRSAKTGASDPDSETTPISTLPAADEKKRILDLFNN